ncbi:WXG100 family type VII secretion target [Streptomyces sp. NPDC058646]|uniref:WXG100 family type VII secretion target n=1 Tax=Streptomyces sp. NPDC058646 TaxID=3346574 RepID=UPI0036512F84
MATNFEGYTHAQLHAMIAAIDPEAVRSRGALLTDASVTLKKIGDDLKRHKVKGWEGEAADAFADWVNKMGSATLVLAEYSEAGGKQMTEAAQVMSEVKPDPGGKGNMPAYNAAADATLRAELQTPRGMDAVAKLNADHARAVDAMNKLAGRYDLSSKEMDKAKVPTFPPPPPVLVPPMVYGQEDLARPGGGGGGGVGSSSSSYGRPEGPGGVSPTEPGSVPGRPPQPDGTPPPTGSVLPPLPGLPDREVDVDLDSVIAPPNPTLPPTTGLPTGPVPGGPGPVLPTPGPFVPPVTLPPVRNVKAPGLTGPGGPFAGPTGPHGPGGKLVGPPGLPPRDAGIMGGRPVTPNGPGAGLPRGTVIGTEGQHAGRGMGGGMGAGLAGPHGGQAGSPVGRRLATEPGGTVGGRSAGSVGGRPVAGGQPFTQGGSGLVRNGHGGAAGAMGHAGAGARTPGQRREEQGGERPDYLAEDEETWQSNRRVVPPVID